MFHNKCRIKWFPNSFRNTTTRNWENDLCLAVSCSIKNFDDIRQIASLLRSKLSLRYSTSRRNVLDLSVWEEKSKRDPVKLQGNLNTKNPSPLLSSEFGLQKALEESHTQARWIMESRALETETYLESLDYF